MSKTITTAILTIAAVVAAMAMVNAIMPAVGRVSGALAQANRQVADRLRTEVAIIYAYGDPGTDTVVFWAKNIGTETVEAIDRTDILLVTPSGVKRLPYGSGAEYWTYALEDGATRWSRGTTARFTLYLSSLPAGEYTVRMVLFSGVSAERTFSVQ